MSKKQESSLELVEYKANSSFLLLYNSQEDRYPTHWHNAVEIIMPIKKRYRVSLGGGDKTYHMKEYEIAIVPSGGLHALEPAEPNGQRIILQFDISVLNTVNGFLNAAYVYANHKFITPGAEPELHEQVKNLLLEMLDEYLNRNPFYDVRIHNKIVEITVALARVFQEEDGAEIPSRRMEQVSKFNACVGYINKNYMENLSLDMVAQAAGLSKFYFSRWFQKFARVPFNDYLINIRFHKAEAMLLGSDKPITEIALEAGFQNITTFNRVFKEYKKCTPTEYRNLKGATGKDEAEEAAKAAIVMNIPPFSAPSGLWTDLPDPDVIRVGDVYYMCSTTMYFNPGCPILRSHDLVNWDIAGYAYDILDDSDKNTLRKGQNAYGKGTWAASLRYRGGTFYVAAASLSTGKTYIFQTENIEGAWRRYTLDGVYHDMSLFFEDDGRVFFLYGSGTIRIVELTEDATAIKPGGLDKVLIEKTGAGGSGGLPAEGSHFYKINGQYYLFLIAWPTTGSGRRIQLCYRSNTLDGEYEGKVVLDDDRGYDNNGVAQGGVVDTPEGAWYAPLFQDHAAVGRIPVLVSVKWQNDGWPVFEIDGKTPRAAVCLPGAHRPGAATRLTASDEFYPHADERDFSAPGGGGYKYTCLNTGGAYSVADEPEKEIILNGRFTEGTAHWKNTDIAELSIVNDPGSVGGPSARPRSSEVLLVSGRATTSSGPSQDITGKVERGGVYEVSARVKYLTGPNVKDFVISAFTGKGAESIRNMGMGRVSRGEWGVIRGTFTVPEDAELSEASVYVETQWTEEPMKSEDFMDFYVEYISMTAKPLYRPTGTLPGENDGNGSFLPPVWQWNHNPDNNHWTLKERVGFLRLKAGYLSHSLLDARNTLTQRTFGPVCSGVIALETTGMRDGDYAGLAALQELYGYVGVKQVNRRRYIIMVSASSGAEHEMEEIPLEEERVYLKADFDFSGETAASESEQRAHGSSPRPGADTACFYYSLDEINWLPIGGVLHMQYKLSHFTGYRFALFYFATQTVGGYADFDYFRALDTLTGDGAAPVILNGSLGGDTEAAGVRGAQFEMPLTLEPLPEGSYNGIYFSMPIPDCLTVEAVAFCNANITGQPGQTFSNGRLQLSVTGEAVSFDNKTSDLFAMLRFSVNDFVQEDTIITLRPDYLYVSGGAAYNIASMKTNVKLAYTPTGAKAKLPGRTNPLISHKYGADPWALAHGGRVYLYLTGDTYEYDDFGRLKENGYGKINTINVISSADLINWTDHGEIIAAGPNGAAAWAAHSWAPAAACKTIDGKEKFFLYFANGASNIGVLTAPSPIGPWSDPLGHPIIHRGWPFPNLNGAEARPSLPGIKGVEGVTWCFDPAVLVDGDGTGYLYFGGGLPSSSREDALHPRTARVIKLGADMISTEGEAVTIDAPALFEDSGINRINGKYYYSYCSNFSGEHPQGYPPRGEIAYMVGDHPMGPFRYAGPILKNPQKFFGVGGNNHHCVFEFNGEWFIAYHAQTLAKALGKAKGYRSPHIDRLAFYSNGLIKPVEAGYKMKLPETVTVNPYEKVAAETCAWSAGTVADIRNGDWIGVAHVNFGNGGGNGLLFSAMVSSLTGGELELRLDSPQGKIIGALGTGSTGGFEEWALRTCEVCPVHGVHHLFLMFKGDSDKRLFGFRYWGFGGEV